ncbi:hypothetical protein CHS0354_024993 [Potamilus streckersoni]|uniref:Uncharacterized protein n=1 Tax=Potamilus streckersoni TaxID=2493646 RepID=A0AAE0W5W0_9BIVA|nr:hypothetical protein CHS0354_024993 [Potamilus streckersoni]
MIYQLSSNGYNFISSSHEHNLPTMSEMVTLVCLYQQALPGKDGTQDRTGFSPGKAILICTWCLIQEELILIYLYKYYHL